ncbi:EamA family transporter [Anabaena cylindrica UHCC 0172]|uniref:EamA family transporter n=1 Tax=Anabaena cylindrica TaxID=1165 RepID=UPI002B1F72C2|nr:EamA family transporter [Anabaena cylindrica]MEA5549391.1 EamA family transporter [Anabaena cylindrica UHCC 0172]
MGRFEKRPDNPRVRGDLSRAAENALWDVVEDLENLQKNVLKSLQDDVKRLEAEKTRLANDIQRLTEEKEKLQQARQITEQQVLIRQLAEVLAKHISSQLQSSLKTLATQSIEGESSERVTLRSAEVNSHAANQINENVGQMLDNLDDSVTIAFSSLQQELKNYQSHLSQQLSRMYDQQQEGEDILAEFINRLKGELDKNRETTSLKVLTGGAPTVLQLNEPHKNGFLEKSPERIISEPISLFPQESPKSENSSPTQENTPEPMSFQTPDSSTKQSTSELSTQENTPEPMSFQTPDSSTKQSTSELSTQENTPEPMSFQTPDSFTKQSTSEPSTQENTPEPMSFQTPDSFTKQSTSEPSTQENTPEPISVLTPDSSTKSSTPESSTQKNTPEPISVLTPDSSVKQSKYSPPLTPKREATTRRERSRSSPSWSPVQVGFLLVVLSTVMSSLYNVAVKALFYKGSEFLGNFETQQLIAPTLGNIFLILMLRLLVVVPLMLLLAPILHPSVWQDLQNLFDSVGRNATPNHAKTKQVLFLSVISGGLLFLSQVLIYIAIGKVSTGIAIALFFIYPLVSGLLAWFLFRERPNLFSAGAISGIFCGELLILGSYSNGMNNTSLGIISGIMSGMAFAVYVILTRLCAPKLHPVSFALINFATMLLLSFICLMVPLPSDWSLAIRSANLLEVILSAFMLGVLTLCGYLFNNFGIRKLGGPPSAIIGALVPVLTVIFAGLMIQEKLDLVQIMGVLLVTGGAVAISFEKMRNQLQSSNTNNQRMKNNETKYRG